MNYAEEDYKNKIEKLDGLATYDKPPIDLPPSGKLIREPLIIGDFYYASRLQSRGSWIKVKLINLVREEGATAKIIVEDKDCNHYFVDGKEVAYSTPCKVKVEVGTRVIAKFDFNACVILGKGAVNKTVKRDSFYPGIIGEPPYAANKYRYLIFFDDGYAQYVEHKNIYVTFQSSQLVWEDINEQNRDFIRKYLQLYPERSMVKLMRRQTVQVEYNGKWFVCVVKDVDASLVQVQFTDNNRLEWIYRGSSRLSPMYEEEKAAKERMQHKTRAARTTTGNNTVSAAKFCKLCICIYVGICILGGYKTVCTVFAG